MSTPTVPVPLALRHLIEHTNQLLQNYQHELSEKVLSANEEMMRMLHLSPQDGWRLNTDTFEYVQVQNDTPVSE
jgi:hypothetical protein